MAECFSSKRDIPLRAPRFGYSEWDDQKQQFLRDRVEVMNGHLVRTLGAVAAIHKPEWPAPSAHLNRFNGIQPSIIASGDGLFLRLDGLPPECFQKTMNGSQMPPRAEKLLQAVLADAVRADWTVEERMFHAGLLGGEGAGFRTFIQGGHTVPSGEYEWAKEVGFGLGTWFSGDLELMTGCGPGVMEGPFKGLLQAYVACDRPPHRTVGLTEIGILAKEAPNGALSDLVMFPNIEQRMEAFIRAAQFGIALRGGAGTMEEILVFAGLMSHSENQGQAYPFYLFEPSDGQHYLHALLGFIERTVGSEVAGLFTHVEGSPQECVSRIMLPDDLRARCQSGYWNTSLAVPGEFLKPFEATREDFERLILSRDCDTSILLRDLRRLFSGLVTVTVKDPALFEAFSVDRPRVKIEGPILDELRQVLLMMNRAKRIPQLRLDDRGELNLPFEFVEP